jgi:hypothetical protein
VSISLITTIGPAWLLIDSLPPPAAVRLEQPKGQEERKNLPEEGAASAAPEGAAASPSKEVWYSIYRQGTIVSQGNWQF